MPAPSSLQLTAEFTPLSAEGAAALLAITHGLAVQHIDRLATERDDTFRVTTQHGLLVAKFAHPLDDADELLDQVTVLRSLAADHAELPVQRVVPATDGALLTSVVDDAGRARLVRVLTHLDGSLLGSAPRSTENMRELGELHARLARAIAAIGDSTDPVLTGASTPWNLLSVDQYATRVRDIDDAELRAASERVIARVRETVLPRARELPAVLAHNDLHGDNVLVSDEPFAVTGVLDFGDMTRTPRVADLAVAASYARGRVGASIQPWAAADAYVAGYSQIQPLTDDEHALLPELVLLRLAQRAILNSAIAAANPDTVSYASRNLSTITRDLRELGASIPKTIGEP